MDSETASGMGGGEHVGWCLIPATIVARRDLSVLEKYLLGRIVGLIGGRGYCFASNAWLGAQLGVVKGTLANLLSKLAKRQLIRVEILRGPDGAVRERRIYPGPALMMAKESEKEGGYSLQNEDLFIGERIPRHRPVKTPLHRAVKEKESTKEKEEYEEGRDMRVEKRDAADAAGKSDVFVVDRPLQSRPKTRKRGREAPRTNAEKGEPAEAVGGSSPIDKGPDVGPPFGSLPYLPRNFSKDHPVCQVLSRFADRWKRASGQTLDVSVGRAIKEIQQRLKTTSLDDLLQLVDGWFDPGLSWVSPSERGAFHTFIQPRAISELKGITAGLSTAPVGRQAAGGYIKPLTHKEWANIPSGPVSVCQGQVVYGGAADGLAAGDHVNPNGAEVKTWQ